MCALLALNPAADVQDAWVSRMSAALSRDPADKPEVFRAPGLAAAWVDLAAGEGVSWRRDSDRFSFLLGSPILDRGGLPDRQADFDLLHGCAGDEGFVDLLRQARGSFGVAHFDLRTRRARLATDKLGIRPVVYGVFNEVLLMASSLRILQGAAPWVLTGNVARTIEWAALRCQLDEYTPVENVVSLRDGQWASIDRQRDIRSFYWRWSVEGAITPDSDVDTASRRLHGTFLDALRLRRGTRTQVTAFLSGGLDSRCVVAGLRQLGTEVQSLNFAPAGSADAVLGSKVAEALGTRHTELTGTDPDAHGRMAQSVHVFRRQLGPLGEQPMWGGAGGQTVLAPTNLNEAVARNIRAGNTVNAIRTLMAIESIELPRRLLRAEPYQRWHDHPEKALSKAIAQLNFPDVARSLHLAVMIGESRTFARYTFEDLDQIRFEQVMPFFDSEFVSASLRLPFDLLLHHRFYYGWLKHFPEGAWQVPWQAYPTSLPCPLPSIPGLRTQWQSYFTNAERRELTRRKLAQARQDIRCHHFPDWLLNKPTLWLAYLAGVLGIDRWTYLLTAMRPFVQLPLPQPPRGG